ncbi:hypothetical protein [Streptomyces sp. NPDC021622]|uniref:hypothetical protein n=1 Tax=Streptomyces sp. NPDC021622 TaxID=3155013 RepID=UPI0033C168CB
MQVQATAELQLSAALREIRRTAYREFAAQANLLGDHHRQTPQIPFTSVFVVGDGLRLRRFKAV